jgi:hypothetical protein
VSGVDLHPEDLLDRVRRGQATAAERERVAAHLAICAACRFEQAVLAESLRDASPQPGDAARARTIEQAALAALAQRGVLAGARKRRRAGAWIAALTASSIATAAAAAVITHPPWLERLVSQLVTPRELPKHKRARAKHDVAPAMVAPPAPVSQATVPEPIAAKQPARSRELRSAGELFAAANEARRERTTREAVRLYRELERQHPSSAEAKVARVALGRLLLDRAGDPRGALRQFEAYLADREQKSLREEAMVGRALALSRLGRGFAERAAWQALLREYPASANAERARARVDELR